MMNIAPVIFTTWTPLPDGNHYGREPVFFWKGLLLVKYGV
jgi:hypothetical protein